MPAPTSKTFQEVRCSWDLNGRKKQEKNPNQSALTRTDGLEHCKLEKVSLSEYLGGFQGARRKSVPALMRCLEDALHLANALYLFGQLWIPGLNQLSIHAPVLNRLDYSNIFLGVESSMLHD